MNAKQNLAVFLAATDSEHKIIQILYRKGQDKIWTELSSLGQEPTLKSEDILDYINKILTPSNSSPSVCVIIVNTCCNSCFVFNLMLYIFNEDSRQTEGHSKAFSHLMSLMSLVMSLMASFWASLFTTRCLGGDLGLN